MTLKKYVAVLILVSLPFIYCHGIKAQGCSDAGACSIPNFKPSAVDSLKGKDNLVSINVSTGAADYGISVFGGQLSYERRIGQRLSLDSKITFLSQSGNGISVSGPGDVYADLNYKISSRLTITGGLKIPLTKADKQEDDLPLPMDYQSSLGTLDLLVGVAYHREKFQWVIAYQQPLTQNENAFFPELYDTLSVLSTIQATNKFQRKGDILLRASLPLVLTNRIMFTPGLLPIYHLGEDQYTDVDGVIQSIDGSSGLTINGTFFLDFALSASSIFELNVGFPFLVRKARPDGLTRGFVLTAEYAVKF